MGEVSNLTGLEPYVLRNWEKSFPQLNPKKNRAGNRAYREHEVNLIFRLKELLLEKKYTVEGVLQILKDESDNSGKEVNYSLSPQARKDLTEIKIFLNNLLESL